MCVCISSLTIPDVVQHASIYHNQTTSAATGRVIWAPNASRKHLRPGLHPQQRWGSLHRSPRPTTWWGEGWLPPPQEHLPRTGPSTSNFGSSGLGRAPRPQDKFLETSATQCHTLLVHCNKNIRKRCYVIQNIKMLLTPCIGSTKTYKSPFQYLRK